MDPEKHIAPEVEEFLARSRGDSYLQREPRPAPAKSHRRLKAISLLVAGLLVAAIVWGFHHKQQQTVVFSEQDIDPTPVVKTEELTVFDVLGWRYKYAPETLIDSYEGFAIDVFGEPKDKNDLILRWEPSEKTGGRSLLALLHHKSVINVTAYPTNGESLDLMKVMLHADLFDFQSTRTPQNEDVIEVSATTKEGDTVLHFLVAGHAIAKFVSVEFR